MTAESVEFLEMPQKGFSGYIDLATENFAKARAKNYNRPLDEARTVSKEQVKEMLKQGQETEGHFFFNITESKTGETVGSLWFNVEPDKKLAFLLDIIVYEPYRGKGYGRKALKLLEAKLTNMDVKWIRLNVFADNLPAISLYESKGYRKTNFNMQKEL
jgi:ribosomal protein S18 acetylase RimI-like enzyme